MGDFMAHWGPEHTALATLIVTNLVAILGWVHKRREQEDANSTELHRQGWERVKELDEEIVRLRCALDRGRKRENAYSTAFELVLLAMKLPHQDQAEIIHRATEILEKALNGGVE